MLLWEYLLYLINVITFIKFQYFFLTLTNKSVAKNADAQHLVLIYITCYLCFDFDIVSSQKLDVYNFAISDNETIKYLVQSFIKYLNLLSIYDILRFALLFAMTKLNKALLHIKYLTFAIRGHWNSLFAQWTDNRIICSVESVGARNHCL